MSFFAFTATPKHKTFAVFGRDGRPAHRYTMRQAIEEEFILDVLKHYTTYATYFGLLKACDDDPIIAPAACWTRAGAPFKPPGSVTPNASFEGSHNPISFPKPSGSTHP